MKSKLPWVPTVTKADSHYIGMPNAKTTQGDESQKTIEETQYESDRDKPGRADGDSAEKTTNKATEMAGQVKRAGTQRTIEDAIQNTTGPSEKKRKKGGEEA